MINPDATHNTKQQNQIDGPAQSLAVGQMPTMRRVVFTIHAQCNATWASTAIPRPQPDPLVRGEPGETEGVIDRERQKRARSRRSRSEPAVAPIEPYETEPSGVLELGIGTARHHK